MRHVRLAAFILFLVACSNESKVGTAANAGAGGELGTASGGMAGNSGATGSGASSGTTAMGGTSTAAGGTNGGTGTGGGNASGGGNVSSGGNTSGNAGNAGNPGSAGSAGSPVGSAGSGGGTASSCALPANLGVRFVGRVDGCDPTGVRYAWSGSGLVAKFAGTGIRLRIKDRPNQYTVVVDGNRAPVLKTTANETLYPLATGLMNAEHVVEVYRRTEASFGPSVVTGIEVEGGQLLTPPAAPSRRIEVVGDSISCGYGNEGTVPTCSFSADTENHYLSYGALLARTLQAEVTTVAWSGKGVVSNYNGDKNEPMPTLYDRVAPSDPKSTWDFRWQADAVIINLGTNDYSTNNDPTDADFRSGYQAFLAHIRSKYPNAFILCTVGPMLSGTDLTTARANIVAAVNARNQAGDTRVKAYAMTTGNPNPGCDYHPSLATHSAMAAELATELRRDLNW